MVAHASQRRIENMSGSGFRPHLETARKLDLRRMFECEALGPNAQSWGTWHWTDSYTGESVGSVSYEAQLDEESGKLTLRYTHQNRDEQRETVVFDVVLSSMPLHYGGRRWFMHCPYTGRRCLALYKFASIEKFCCRTAIRPLPTYASQRISGRDRIFAQRWAIRRRLGDDVSDLFGEPHRPKGMHWRTFQSYVDRDSALEKREGGYLLRLISCLQRHC